MDGMLKNHRQRPKDVPEEWRSMYPPEESLADQYKQAKSQYPKKDDSVVGAGTYGQVYKTINVYKPEQGHVALKRVAMASESSGNVFHSRPSGNSVRSSAIKDLRMPKYSKQWSCVCLARIRRSLISGTIWSLSTCRSTWLHHQPSDSRSLISATEKIWPNRCMKGWSGCMTLACYTETSKLEIFLCDHGGILKLTDFGLAKRFDPKKGPHGRHTNRIVTIWYRCPELLLGDVEYGTEPDFWAAGVRAR